MYIGIDLALLRTEWRSALAYGTYLIAVVAFLNDTVPYMNGIVDVCDSFMANSFSTFDPRVTKLYEQISTFPQTTSSLVAIYACVAHSVRVFTTNNGND